MLISVELNTIECNTQDTKYEFELSCQHEDYKTLTLNQFLTDYLPAGGSDSLIFMVPQVLNIKFLQNNQQVIVTREILNQPIVNIILNQYPKTMSQNTSLRDLLDQTCIEMKNLNWQIKTHGPTDDRYKNLSLIYQ